MLKKKWKKPELQIISKSTPEENVLGTCKNLPMGTFIVNGPQHHGCKTPVNNAFCKMENCS